MGKKQLLLLGVMVSAMMAGCSLEVPPVCLIGDEKCEQSVSGAGIYYVCTEDGIWSAGISCGVACEGKHCGAGAGIALPCSTEGEKKCVESGDKAMLFVCRNNNWVLSMCSDNCVEGTCHVDNSCLLDQNYCAEISFINQAVALECIDGEWVSNYCGSGVACEGDKCGKKNCTVGDACEKVDLQEGWASGIYNQDCRCELASCLDGYAQNDGECVKCPKNMYVDESGKCACPEGYFVDLDHGICEPPACDGKTFDACGYSCMDCQNLPYADNGFCSGNSCFVTECKQLDDKALELNSNGRICCPDVLRASLLPYNAADGDIGRDRELDNCALYQIQNVANWGYQLISDLSVIPGITCMDVDLDEYKKAYSEAYSSLPSNFNMPDELEANAYRCMYNCDENWFNCDLLLENGCEVDGKEFHITGCGNGGENKCGYNCSPGYADCDGECDNGCEIFLADYNLASCDKCLDGYQRCEDGECRASCECPAGTYPVDTDEGIQCYECKNAKYCGPACNNCDYSIKHTEGLESTACVLDDGEDHLFSEYTCVPATCVYGYSSNGMRCCEDNHKFEDFASLENNLIQNVENWNLTIRQNPSMSYYVTWPLLVRDYNYDECSYRCDGYEVTETNEYKELYQEGKRIFVTEYYVNDAPIKDRSHRYNWYYQYYHKGCEADSVCFEYDFCGCMDGDQYCDDEGNAWECSMGVWIEECKCHCVSGECHGNECEPGYANCKEMIASDGSLLHYQYEWCDGGVLRTQDCDAGNVCSQPASCDLTTGCMTLEPVAPNMMECGDRCVDITDIHTCGGCDNDCTSATYLSEHHAKSAECAGGSDGTTVNAFCCVRECADGYHETGADSNGCLICTKNDCDTVGEKTCTNQSDGRGVVTECKEGFIPETRECDTSCGPTGTDGKTDCGKCINDSEKCENNSGNVGEQYKCETGTWTKKNNCEGNASCTATEPKICGECQNNTHKCTTNSDLTQPDYLENCEGGGYTHGTVCTTTVQNAVAACKTEEECGGYRCKNGYTQCGDSCVDTKNDVNHCGGCSPCELQAGAESMTCDNGTCKIQTCDSSHYEYIRPDGEKECLTRCTTGENRCVNSSTGTAIIYTCNDVTGQFDVDTSCTGSCTSGGGCGVCKNDESRCTDQSNHVGSREICSQGAWGTSTDCSYSSKPVSCNPDGKNCGTCLIGDVVYSESDNKCVGQTCTDGINKSSSNCTDSWDYFNGTSNVSSSSQQVSCNSTVTSCGECYNGNIRCLDKNILQTCVKGSYSTTQDCRTITDSGTGYCEPDPSSPSTNAECKVSCASDQVLNGHTCCKAEYGRIYNQIDNCLDFSCDTTITHLEGGTCVPNECTNGEEDCANNRRCVNYKWENNYCTNSCTTDNKCGACVNGTKQVTPSNNLCYYKVCRNGVWPTGNNTCTGTWTYLYGNTYTSGGVNHSVSCNADNTDCGTCYNGMYPRCFDQTTLQTCSSGEYHDYKNCANEFSNVEHAINRRCYASNASDAACTFDCESGYHKVGNTCEKNCTEDVCLNGKIQVCNKSTGVLGTATNCPNNNSCMSASACGECHNTDTRCLDNTTHQECVNGIYQTDQICDDVDPTGHSTPICETWLSSTAVCKYQCDSGYEDNGVACCETKPGRQYKSNNDSCEFTCSSGYREVINSNGEKDCAVYKCTDNAEMCANDPGTGLGIVKKCVNNEWEEIESCSNSCKDNACGDCIDNSVQCENSGKTGYLTTCSNGTKSTSACNNNYSCNSAGTACGVCVNDDTTCSNNGSYIGQVKTCNEGAWGTAVSCETVSCNNTNKGCGSCKNNTIVRTCYESGSAAYYQKCVSGRGLTYGCGNVSCDPNSTNPNKCGVCKDGAKQCSDNNYQSCNTGAWVTNEICSAPTNGTPSCTATAGCDFTCNTGYCKSGTDCVSQQTDMNNCGSCGSVCNTSKVSNSTAVTCSAGRCIATACAGGHSLVDGACPETVCTDGAIKCENTGATGKMYKCVENGWVEQSTCSNNYSCNSAGTGCGACYNNTKQCVSSGSELYQLCSTGEWSTTTYNCGAELPNSICQNNACVCPSDYSVQGGECCLIEAGRVYNGSGCSFTCDTSNNYREVTGTDGQKHCALYKCTENATKCENSGTTGKMYKCENNVWVVQHTCSNSYSCKSTTECGECVNNTKECSDSANGIGQLTTCSNGTKTTNACSGNNSCKSTTECGSCRNGVTSCGNGNNAVGQLTTCTGGVPTTEACSGNNSCKSTTECGSCNNNVTSCSNNGNIGQLTSCSNGTPTTAPCSGNNSCMSTTSCGTCQNGVTTCTNSGNIGQKTTCSGGKPSTSACPNSYSCNAAGNDCGVCQNNSAYTQCNGLYPQNCVAGAWTNRATACSEDEVGAEPWLVMSVDCSDGKCIATECIPQIGALCNGYCKESSCD